MAVARDVFREAGLPPEARVFLSGGGADSAAVRAGLGDFVSEDPVTLDPLEGLDLPVYGPAYSVAAGLAYQQILDQSGPGTGLRS